MKHHGFWSNLQYCLNVDLCMQPKQNSPQIHIPVRTRTVLQTLKVHIILRMMMNVTCPLGFVLFTVPTFIANTEYTHFHIKNTTNNNLSNMQMMYFSLIFIYTEIPGVCVY